MHADVENDRMVWCSAKIFFVNSTQLTWSVEWRFRSVIFLEYLTVLETTRTVPGLYAAWHIYAHITYSMEASGYRRLTQGVAWGCRRRLGSIPTRGLRLFRVKKKGCD
jgi:hypothetical protein